MFDIGLLGFGESPTVLQVLLSVCMSRSVIVSLSLSVFIVVVVLFVRCVLSVLSVAWRVSLQCWIRKHWLWLVPSRGLHSHKLGWSGWGRKVGGWSEGNVGEPRWQSQHFWRSPHWWRSCQEDRWEDWEVCACGVGAFNFQWLCSFSRITSPESAVAWRLPGGSQ